MAISEIEKVRCKKAMAEFLTAHRPPPEIRDQVDISYKMENQSVEIFEIRPYWEDPSIKTETPVAKTTYVKKSNRWKVYWFKSDMKWHGYPPCPEVKLFEEFLDLVAKDKHACFFG